MSAKGTVKSYDIRRSWHGADDSWMAGGACNTGLLTVAEKRAYFADLDRGAAAAVAVQGAKLRCLRCPVREECLEYALAAGMRGIWGGLTERERSMEARRRRMRSRA